MGAWQKRATFATQITNNVIWLSERDNADEDDIFLSHCRSNKINTYKVKPYMHT